MTTTQKTTETTHQQNHRKVDVTRFRDRHPAVVTAVVSLASGLAIGAVVATAMGGDRDRYLRFVGVATIVAVATVLWSAYRTYVDHRTAPVVVETTPGEKQEIA